MATQKTGTELAEIMSAQLDALMSSDVSSDEIHLADSVANMIGKTLKLATLQMAYAEHIKNGGKIILTLESK